MNSVLFPLRGIHSSDCSLRPAAGYRHWTTGVLTNVGAEGDSWSSSSFAAGDHRAGYLNFNATWVNPLNAWYRSIAFPVRCVQASAGCFRATKTGGIKPPVLRLYDLQYYFFLGSEPLSMAKVDTMTIFSSTLLGLETMTPYSPLGRVSKTSR